MRTSTVPTTRTVTSTSVRPSAINVAVCSRRDGATALWRLEARSAWLVPRPVWPSRVARVGWERVDQSSEPIHPSATPTAPSGTGNTRLFSAIGGIQYGWVWRSTWPFARLDMFPWGVRLGPGVRWLIVAGPVRRLAWADIESVRCASDLRFRRRAGTMSITFGAFRSLTPVIDALRANGVALE